MSTTAQWHTHRRPGEDGPNGGGGLNGLVACSGFGGGCALMGESALFGQFGRGPEMLWVERAGR